MALSDSEGKKTSFDYVQPLFEQKIDQSRKKKEIYQNPKTNY